MTTEEIVRQVVGEVLKRLEPAAAGEKIIILARPDDENVSALQQQLGDAAEVSISGDVAGAARVIIPLLSCTQLADLAVGRATNGRFQQLLTRLLKGRSVEVFEYEHQRFAATAPRQLYALYEKYRQSLVAFGVVPYAGAAPVAAAAHREVVTEADIVAAAKQNVRTMRIAATALVTPLARDCARERGIQLEKDERRDT